MRRDLIVAVIGLAMLAGVAQAQMRGGAGFRGGRFGGGGGGSVVPGVHAWSQRSPVFSLGRRGFHHGIVFTGSFGGFGGVSPFCNFGRCFGSSFFGSNFGHHHRSFFGGAFSSGYGYGYGAPIYYPASGFDISAQNEAYDQQQWTADRARAYADMEEDRRRDMELQRQVEELNAAHQASLQRADNAQQPQPAASAVPATPAVLVFRDGHQVQVQNYAIAGEKLYSLGPDQKRTILLSDLDLPATMKANEDRGVNFIVPRKRQ